MRAPAVLAVRERAARRRLQADVSQPLSYFCFQVPIPPGARELGWPPRHIRIGHIPLGSLPERSREVRLDQVEIPALLPCKLARLQFLGPDRIAAHIRDDRLWS